MSMKIMILTKTTTTIGNSTWNMDCSGSEIPLVMTWTTTNVITSRYTFACGLASDQLGTSHGFYDVVRFP